jgi:hypothetical protein
MNWRKRPGTGLFVAEHPSGAIGAVGQLDVVEILGDVARQRRGQVIAQRQPLIVIVLEREHALVGPVLVRQELAQRIGVFDEGRFHRLETEALVNQPDLGHHLICRADVGRPNDQESHAPGAPSASEVSFAFASCRT